MPLTLSEKIWDRHVVVRGATARDPDLLYIDLHLVHEVTSPQAFEGLRLAGRKVRRPDLTVATADHNVPTIDIDKEVADPISRRQLEMLSRNCAEFGVTEYPMGSINQGIVHVIGPEQGLTQPGMTIVCGDSHTSTHGAFGALAFGIGTSEVEHVLATQTLAQARPKTMAVEVDGELEDAHERERPRPRHHRTDRHGGGIGHVSRVPRFGDPGAVDGGPDDRLQHVDRSRRTSRDDRPRRGHLLLPRGPPASRRRARHGRRRSRTGEASSTDPEAAIDTTVVELEPTTIRPT